MDWSFKVNWSMHKVLSYYLVVSKIFVSSFSTDAQDMPDREFTGITS